MNSTPAADAATLGDVREFYDRYYGANNATLVIAGDIDIEQTRTLVERWFGEIRRGPEIPALEPKPAKLEATASLYHVDNFAKLPELRLVFPTVEQYHEEVFLPRVPQTGMEVVVDVRWAANHGSGSKSAAREPAPDLQRRSQARALGGPDSLGSPEFAATHPREILEPAVTAEQIRCHRQGIAAAIARAEQEGDQLRITQS